MIKRTLPWFAAVLSAAALAAPASAAPIFGYQDVLYDVGFVVEGGSDLVYEHTFAPDVDAGVTVHAAWLSVKVVDDPICWGSSSCDISDIWESEWIEIDVNGTAFDEGYASWFGSFSGDVTAHAAITGVGDAAEVAVRAIEGDAWVISSRLLVAYSVDETGEAIQPIASAPEPSSAIVFAVGALLVARTARRR